MTHNVEFNEWFTTITGHEEPYSWQRALASDEACRARMIGIPTGLGKTEGVLTTWSYHRIQRVDEKWPRRLVWCLPMRVLVEQTEQVARRLVDQMPESGRPTVHVAMGGEDRGEWFLYPEQPAIIIGTQDMLLSRALNRGYAARRPHWPIEFGLLNNDCLWVFDEVQLMGPGLGTGLQLEAFRNDNLDGKPYFGTAKRCVSWYMSATASRRLLTTREWRKNDGDKRPTDFVFKLSPDDMEDTKTALNHRRLATKQLECQSSWSLEDSNIAENIVSRHQAMLNALDGAPSEIPRRTLIICNTVLRARATHAALASILGNEASQALVLLHSRFRPPDRKRQQDRLKAQLAPNIGQIVVATQVVEAGVDLSSAILWTEIAPLPSIVQRLGRLNRAGEFGHNAERESPWTPLAVILGVHLPAPPARQTVKAIKQHEKEVARAYLPYDRCACEVAEESLKSIHDVSPANLDAQLRAALDSVLQPPEYSLQRHELLDFFDTDSNLSLGYTDVSPFIRGVDPETDIYVVWRQWDGDVPPYDFDIGRHEICQVPIWHVIGKDGLKTWQQGYIWEGREQGWKRATRDNLLAGATLLLPSRAGGYEIALGWTGDKDTEVDSLYQPSSGPTDEDLLSNLERGWQSIESHTDDVQSCWTIIREALALDDEELCAAIDDAILWHDYGKAIEEWQEATKRTAIEAQLIWPEQIAPVGKFAIRESPLLESLTGSDLKREILRLKRTFRPGLRHEVASALALRQHHRGDGRDPTIHELLAEYLVMAHHGHVRKALRDELPRDPQRIRREPDEVRGIRQGSAVPGFSIKGCALPTTEAISITCRQMGRSSDGQESWTRTVLRLLERFGPFRLAYYEALVRVADCRASAAPKTNLVNASHRDSRIEPVSSAGNGETE